MLCLVAVSALLLTLLAAGFCLSLHASDRFGSLLAGGITSLPGLPSILYFAVAFDWVNIHSPALPVVSEAGSNVCITLFCAGLLLSVATHPELAFPLDEGDHRSRAYKENQVKS